MVVPLFVLNLVMGSVSIPVADTLHILMGDEAARPSWRYIILESRLPQAITAMFSGASLAVSGLMLQTAFRNPLAGPSIFGINSGAGLGVALVDRCRQVPYRCRALSPCCWQPSWEP